MLFRGFLPTEESVLFIVHIHYREETLVLRPCYS